MMKLLVRFLLSLCFLLLGGNVHTSQDRIDCLPGNVFERSEQAVCFALQNHKIKFTRTPSSGSEKVRDRAKATEVEDDDYKVKPKEKDSESNCCIALYYTQASEYINRYLKGRLPFCEHFSLISTDKFIIHRVIRI